MRGWETLKSDLGFAVRLIRARPGFAAVVVATLALAIGANTAIFSLADATLLRPLPYERPEELHVLTFGAPAADGRAETTGMPWSYPKFESFLRSNRAFSEVIGFTGDYVAFTADDTPERLAMEYVTGNYFSMLGVSALRGRTFTPEQVPGAPLEIVLSEGAWQAHFGGRDDVIGRTARVNGVSGTIVGVAPGSFRGVSGSAQLWLPITAAQQLIYPEILTEQGNHWLEVLARAPAYDAAAAAPLLANSMRAIVSENPNGGGENWSIAVEAFRTARQDPVLKRAVFVLLGAVSMMLLIACVNVANLLLVRATQREREIAVRISLGATRRRLVAQLLTESVVFALAGMAAGMLLAVWSVDLLSSISPDGRLGIGIEGNSILELQNLGLNGRVLAYAIGTTLLTGALFGVAPALQLAGSQAQVLRRSAQGAVSRPAMRWLGGGRGALVVAEIALALMLLSGAAVMLRSFARLTGTELGFDPNNVLTFSIEPPPSEYSTPEARQLQLRVLERVQGMPGVLAAGIDRCAPLTICMISAVNRAGDREIPQGEGPEIGVHSATPDYFAALRTQIVRGRAFGPQDREGAPRVAIISETTANTLFPGQDPIGQRIAVLTSAFGGGEEPAEIVGVAGDVKYSAPDQEGVPLQVYVSGLQWGTRRGTFMVRTAGDPRMLIGAIRDAVRAEAAGLPVYDIKTMQERAAAATAKARFATLLLATFAGASLLLAAVGVYGVISFAVAQRTRELGVRMALGAQRIGLLQLVLAQGARLLLLGIIIGLAGSVAANRVLRGLLFEVEPNDPIMLTAGVGLMAVVATLAVLVPAVRAMRNDPMAALRYQ